LRKSKRFRKIFAVIISLAILTSSISYYYFRESIKSHRQIGINIHLSDFEKNPQKIVDLLLASKTKWVRTDWIIDHMTDFMNAMKSNGINVLAIIDNNTLQTSFTLPEWKSVVENILNTSEAKNVDAWEIWNEPNVPDFNLGYMDGQPSHYFQMLKLAYTTIKNQSSSPVIFAGLSPYGEWLNWVKDVYDLGAESYFDVQGVHLYDELPINKVILQDATSLTNKSIWITEIGRQSYSPYSEEDQTMYLEQNFKELDKQANAIFWYELVDNTGGAPEKENHFGLARNDYSFKPAFSAFSKYG
jgi:O-glycosyl hydrolase